MLIHTLKPGAARINVALALALSVPGLAAAGSLAEFTTVYDTDFTAVGVGGLRGVGSGSITLSGVTGAVSSAYLYWHGPNSSTNNLNNATVTFNGNAVTGTFLGASDDNCWGGFANSLAYRADITDLVSGNGTYSLADFMKGGSDINGVSLITFFDDGNAANNRDVVIFDGNDSNVGSTYDTLGWNITLDGIDYTAGTANAQFHVSDGQYYTDDAVVANGTTLASGGVFDGLTVPGANVGPQNLWDITNFNVTSLLAPGTNTLNITTGYSRDCLSCVMIAIDLPAGAAPVVPVPAAAWLFGSGLLGLVGVTRRKARAA